MLAIIGGTGVKVSDLLENRQDQQVETPFGSAAVSRGRIGARELVVLYRHGAGHTVPPHRINYRANLWALRKLGVRQVLATAAVGSLNPALRPGDMVLVDQFLDFTKGRAHTFFDGGPEGVVHVDVSEPYCPRMRRRLGAAAAELGFPLHEGGVYLCTEGPRFETPAEIRAYRMLGADVVGMTGVPEVVLAREAGLCYATVALVTNMAAGISQGALSHDEVVAVMDTHGVRMRQLVLHALDKLDEGAEGEGAASSSGSTPEAPWEPAVPEPACPCRRYRDLLPGLG